MSVVFDALCKMDLAGLLADGLREPAPTPGPAAWAAPETEDLRGAFARYELVRLLGRGGMGAVYEARQPDLERTVAMKVLPVELGQDEVFAERFRREARALGRLRYPHVLEVYEFGESSTGHLFFTMEYLPGGDLGTRLKDGPLPPAEALRIVREICLGLAAAHAQGIIHRDIKPSNILRSADGTVKVADFGLAVLPDRPGDRFTHTGLAMGTFEYAAPEQVSGAPVDARSDVYSVGVLCYELLTGRLPRGVFDPPSRAGAAVSPAVDAVVRMAMQNDPDRRYQSAGDMWAALHRAEEPPPPPWRRWTLGASLVALALAAAHHWWPVREQAPSTAIASPSSPTPIYQTTGAAVAYVRESERLFADLERPSGTTEHARQWAGANESAGLAVTRQEGENNALVYYTRWISRLENKRASAPDDPRWMVALAATLNRRGNIVRGTDPGVAIKTFELSAELYRSVWRASPLDPAARRDVATSLCKILDVHREYSAPQPILAACREVIADCTKLPTRLSGEEWFDQYLGTSCANALQQALGTDPSVRAEVAAVAREARRTIFDRPGANPSSLSPEAARARQTLTELSP